MRLGMLDNWGNSGKSVKNRRLYSIMKFKRYIQNQLPMNRFNLVLKAILPIVGSLRPVICRTIRILKASRHICTNENRRYFQYHILCFVLYINLNKGSKQISFYLKKKINKISTYLDIWSQVNQVQFKWKNSIWA